MGSDNEKQNIQRMLEYVEQNEERMAEMAKDLNELRQSQVALNDRITQLMQQMQQTMLIGRGSGPTA